jgi:hypothetical protein
MSLPERRRRVDVHEGGIGPEPLRRIEVGHRICKAVESAARPRSGDNCHTVCWCITSELLRPLQGPFIVADTPQDLSSKRDQFDELGLDADRCPPSAWELLQAIDLRGVDSQVRWLCGSVLGVTIGSCANTRSNCGPNARD